MIKVRAKYKYSFIDRYVKRVIIKYFKFFNKSLLSKYVFK